MCAPTDDDLLINYKTFIPRKTGQLPKSNQKKKSEKRNNTKNESKPKQSKTNPRLPFVFFFVIVKRHNIHAPGGKLPEIHRRQ